MSRLGFDNYAAFQQALLEDLSARVLSPIEVYRSHVAASDHPPLELAATALAEAVTDTLAQLSPPDFERAVSLVADERHRVLVTGGWTSHLLAAMLTSLVRPFRSGVLHVPSLAAERAASLADLARDDVVVLFDFRRYELDTFEFARLARDRGGRLVLLTDPWLSPIADLADAVLPAQVDGPVTVREPRADRRAGGDPGDGGRTSARAPPAPTDSAATGRSPTSGSGPSRERWNRPRSAHTSATKERHES